MLFTEGRFFVLYAVVFALYWTLRANGPRKGLLLAASYVFYGAWDWRFLGLLWLSTLLDYGAGLLLDPGGRFAPRRKPIVIAAVVANLGILGIFKYYDFFVSVGASAAAIFGVTTAPPLLHLILPAGISFYTFQSMSYTIDVYRGMRAERRLLDYALFVSFFPQLVAGPIVRAADFLPQLGEKRRWADVDVRAALVVFWIGFLKKAVIADNIAPLVDAYFAAPAGYTAGSAWTALVSYNVQLYGDFSGYSDMAIGSAALLGFRLRENFRAPFLATSPLDYWRRWHTSFSTWLRDYVYVSLGGDRGTERRTRLNILVTLILSGLWHGAGWQYIAFGGLHGLGIVNQRSFRETVLYTRIPRRVRTVLGFAFTHWLFCVLRAMFRAPTLAASAPILAACLLGASTGTAALPAWGWATWGAMFIAQLIHARGWVEERWRRPRPVVFAVAYGLAWAAALTLRTVDYRPFVYFTF